MVNCSTSLVKFWCNVFSASGSKINFFVNKCQSNFPFTAKHKNAESFKTFLCVKIILLLNDRKSQIPDVKALYSIIQSHRSQFIFLFFYFLFFFLIFFNTTYKQLTKTFSLQMITLSTQTKLKKSEKQDIITIQC